LAPLRVPLLGLFLYVCMYVCHQIKRAGENGNAAKYIRKVV
jgi:hypothetical protein